MNVFHPLHDEVHVRIGEAERGAHRGGVQEGEHLGRGDPLIAQIEQGEKGVCDPARLAHAPVRYAVRDSFPVVFGRIEYRLDERGVRFDIGRHHQNVPRLQPGVAFEHFEEVVVEDFRFSHGAVARVDLDGSVVSGDFDLAV
ncbi:MAG TPA: hypothetical protein VE134_05525, partial [Methanomicrobiales archaeon]|nr:hypothetical protein [Methanomicrobiales archaeon]